MKSKSSLITSRLLEKMENEKKFIIVIDIYALKCNILFSIKTENINV